MGESVLIRENAGCRGEKFLSRAISVQAVRRERLSLTEK
jgi:hypothetical protein